MSGNKRRRAADAPAGGSGTGRHLHLDGEFPTLGASRKRARANSGMADDSNGVRNGDMSTTPFPREDVIRLLGRALVDLGLP